MQIRKLALVILSTAALAACGSAKDASESNFAGAINTFFDAHCTSLSFGWGLLAGTHPSEHGYPLVVADAWWNGKPNTEQQAAFDALVKAGVLTSTKTELVSSPGGTGRPAKSYSLTELGRQAQKDPEHLTLCVGHRHVTEVVQYSEPSDALGATMSDVTYTYTLDRVPDWVKDPAVRAAFPQVEGLLKPDQKAQATATLMNDGWKVGS